MYVSLSLLHSLSLPLSFFFLLYPRTLTLSYSLVLSDPLCVCLFRFLLFFSLVRLLLPFLLLFCSLTSPSPFSCVLFFTLSFALPPSYRSLSALPRRGARWRGPSSRRQPCEVSPAAPEGPSPGTAHDPRCLGPHPGPTNGQRRRLHRSARGARPGSPEEREQGRRRAPSPPTLDRAPSPATPAPSSPRVADTGVQAGRAARRSRLSVAPARRRIPSRHGSGTPRREGSRGRTRALRAPAASGPSPRPSTPRHVVWGESKRVRPKGGDPGAQVALECLTPNSGPD